MSNFTTNPNEIKRKIINQHKKISFGLSKPKQKFLLDMSYGLAASQSVLISEIARHLQEDSKLLSTIERLCKNTHTFSRQDINLSLNNYFKAIKPVFEDHDDVHVVLDDTDITKPYGYKFEKLCKVIDGSDKSKKLQKGYIVNEAVAISPVNKQVFPIHSHIYSTEDDGFISKFDETKKAVIDIKKMFSNHKVTISGDRAFGTNKHINHFINNGLKFNLRLKKNRKIVVNKEIINIEHALENFNNSFESELYFNDGKKNKVNICYGSIGVMDKECSYLLYLVCVYDNHNDDPIFLVTNKVVSSQKEAYEIARQYCDRWRIEVNFRDKKQEYDFENIRVRTIDGFNTIAHILMMHLGHLSLIAETKMTNELFHKIIDASKSIRKKVGTWTSQLARGIQAILAHAKTGVKSFHKIESRPKTKQLSFKFEFTY